MRGSMAGCSACGKVGNCPYNEHRCRTCPKLGRSRRSAGAACLSVTGPACVAVYGVPRLFEYSGRFVDGPCGCIWTWVTNAWEFKWKIENVANLPIEAPVESPVRMRGRRCWNSGVFGRVCVHCGPPQKACTQPGGGPAGWLCVNEHAILHTGIVPWRFGHGAGQLQRASTATWHRNAAPPVDAWIVPRTERCLLIHARFIAWRVRGVILGLVLGPPDRGPDAASTWGRNGATFHADKYAQYLVDNWLNGLWPPGGAPIILTRMSAANFVAVTARAALHVPAAEMARLRDWNASLSMEPGRNQPSPVANWDYASFCVDNPLVLVNGHPGTNCLLVTRVDNMSNASALPNRGSHLLTANAFEYLKFDR